MDKMAQAFYEEAVDLLVSLEGLLLDLEKKPESTELINNVFRAMHTLKGSGSMFGFTQLAAFVHNIESTFDLVRQSKLVLTHDIINLTLEAKDLMKLLIEQDKQISPEQSERIEDITQAYIFLSARPEPANKKPVAAVVKKPAPTVELPIEPEPQNVEQLPINKFHIYFHPNPEFFNTGNNPLITLEELMALGEAVIEIDASHVPGLETIDPEKSYLAWKVALTTNVDENAVRDVFLFVEDICELRIETSKASDNAGMGKYPKTAEATPEVRIDNIVIDCAAEEETGQAYLPEQTIQSAQTANGRFEASTNAAAIKVDAGKLDRLVSLLGELVTVQARLSQTAETRGDTELITLAQELDTLTDDLRESALKLSMVPINSIFPRFEKLVNTGAATGNKKVRLVCRGGETELDKGVMSKLFEPLSQLIAFCVEHSLENESRRKEAGKAPEGQIEFAAWHSSGNVCLSIEDNGQGGDVNANPAISGVRRLIEELRGHLDCKSTAGKGVSFTIRMPLNLAIIEGLMIRLEDGLFVFPLSLVEECIELTEEDQLKNFNKNVVMLRGQIIPYIKLRDTFKISGNAPAIQQVVITNVNHQRVGFTVDQVVGEYQTVIKSWGKFCSDTPGITGATILGDGTVALIADLPQLINEERHIIQIDAEAHS